MRENGRGFLFSVEGDPEWAANTASMLEETEEPDLHLYFAVFSSPVQRELAMNFDGRELAGWLYMFRPRISPDFIYIDGPELDAQARLTFSPLLYFSPLEFHRKTTMIIDGRHETVAFYREMLKFYQPEIVEAGDSTIFNVDPANAITRILEKSN